MQPRSVSVSEPDNLVLRRLRELRADMDQRFEATGAEIKDMKRRLDSLSQAITGESVIGRYMVAEVEEQLVDLGQRLTALEAPR